jgi:hypothetical protein
VLGAVVCCLGLVALSGVSSQARAVRRHGSALSASRCVTGGSTSQSLVFYGGAKLLSVTNLQICVTGRLTVTFAGDSAAGCAVDGLCGYAGTDTWEPENFGEVSFSTFEQRGRDFTVGTMIIGFPGDPVLSAVQHTQSTGNAARCSDQGSGGGPSFSLPVSAGRVTVGLRAAVTPLLGTRCAGPLDADVAAAMPVRTLRLRRLLRGRLSIDLTGSRRFAAHGLVGTVQSTIVVVLGRPQHPPQPPHSSPPTSGKRGRLAEATYRVTRVGGGAIATVRSSADPSVCGPFDACGLQGAIDVAPGSSAGGFVNLIAEAPLRRPRRDLLSAFGAARGGDPVGIRLRGGGGLVSLRGTVGADLTQANTCRDHVALREASIQLQQRSGRLEISVSPALTQAADPLRTRCPGPDLGTHSLTSASVPLGVIRRHASFTVALHGDSFSDGPYRITTRSTVTLTLRRERVTTLIVRSASS